LRRLAASLLLTLAVVTSAVAQGIPPGQRTLLLLRVLAYDRNLKTRAGAVVRIAVVYRPGTAASEHERDALLQAIEEIASHSRVMGLTVRSLAVPYRDASDLRSRLAASGAAAMYLCTGLESAGRDLARTARELSVLSFCGSRELAMGGCAVALVDRGERGERAALVVNLRAAIDQGADLDSALLSVAERIESAD
jgi:hypothetical protein